MTTSGPVLLYAAIGLTVLFAFINGFHDGCNVIATMISSRSMSPYRALLLASVAEFVGPLLLGTAVAATIAHGILDVRLLATLTPASLHVMIIAAVGGGIVWNLATWLLGLPSSSSHALIGGLLGAGIVTLGPEAVAGREIMVRVVLPLFLSPLAGVVVGFLAFAFVRGAFARSHASARHFFVTMQKPGMLFLAASHGSNDAQKSMGLIGLALAAGAMRPGGNMEIPWWVVIVCAAAIALGLSTGGWRIIRTLGFGIFRIRPVHSFSSQLSSTSVILAASLLGGPVSTTQVVASSVVGVGASRRLGGVRWRVARNISYAWIMTIPAAAAVGAVLCWGLQRTTGG